MHHIVCQKSKYATKAGDKVETKSMDYESDISTKTGVSQDINGHHKTAKITKEMRVITTFLLRFLVDDRIRRIFPDNQMCTNSWYKIG